MLMSMLPWFAMVLLLGIVLGLVIGIGLGSALVKGHYTHILDQIQPLWQSQLYDPRDGEYVRRR